MSLPHLFYTSLTLPNPQLTNHILSILPDSAPRDLARAQNIIDHATHCDEARKCALEIALTWTGRKGENTKRRESESIVKGSEGRKNGKRKRNEDEYDRIPEQQETKCLELCRAYLGIQEGEEQMCALRIVKKAMGKEKRAKNIGRTLYHFGEGK